MKIKIGKMEESSRALHDAINELKKQLDHLEIIARTADIKSDEIAYQIMTKTGLLREDVPKEEYRDLPETKEVAWYLKLLSNGILRKINETKGTFTRDKIIYDVLEGIEQTIDPMRGMLTDEAVREIKEILKNYFG